MGVLSDESVRGAAGYAPLVVRVLVGVVMAAHGRQKPQGDLRISARPSQGWLGVLLRLNVGHSTKHRTYDC